MYNSQTSINLKLIMSIKEAIVGKIPQNVLCELNKKRDEIAQSPLLEKITIETHEQCAVLWKLVLIFNDYSTSQRLNIEEIKTLLNQLNALGKEQIDSQLNNDAEQFLNYYFFELLMTLASMVHENEESSFEEITVLCSQILTCPTDFFKLYLALFLIYELNDVNLINEVKQKITETTEEPHPLIGTYLPRGITPMHLVFGLYIKDYSNQEIFDVLSTAINSLSSSELLACSIFGNSLLQAITAG